MCFAQLDDVVFSCTGATADLGSLTDWLEVVQACGSDCESPMQMQHKVVFFLFR